jgi:hypothetical protein
MGTRKALLVLLGPHGAGKTAIGSSMPKTEYAFFREVGRELRSKVDFDVTTSCFLFDQEVMKLELARDTALRSETRLPVIETWHVGNIAFALARGHSDLASRYLGYTREQLSLFDPAIVRLKVSDEVFVSRVTESRVSSVEALSFYRRVESHYSRILVDLGIPDGERVIVLEEDAQLARATATVQRFAQRLRLPHEEGA